MSVPFLKNMEKNDWKFFMLIVKSKKEVSLSVTRAPAYI